jgi:hypothetical protein
VYDGIDLHQDVCVFGVDVEGTSLLVDIYGGDTNICGSVRFRFPDRDERDASLEQLVRWRVEGTPLSLVTRGSMVALQNDRALFAAQVALPGA